MFFVKVFGLLIIIRFLVVDGFSANFRQDFATTSGSAENDESFVNSREITELTTNLEETTETAKKSAIEYESSGEEISLKTTVVTQVHQIYELTTIFAASYQKEFNDSNNKIFQIFKAKIDNFFNEKCHLLQVHAEIFFIGEVECGIQMEIYVYVIEGRISEKVLKKIIESRQLFDRMFTEYENDYKSSDSASDETF